jgi:hypothetical protein
VRSAIVETSSFLRSGVSATAYGSAGVLIVDAIAISSTSTTAIRSLRRSATYATPAIGSSVIRPASRAIATWPMFLPARSVLISAPLSASMTSAASSTAMMREPVRCGGVGAATWAPPIGRPISANSGTENLAMDLATA